MKKLLIALTMVLASNAFATTYFVQYTISTVNKTTQLDKAQVLCLPSTAPSQGSISVYTTDEQNKPVYLKQDVITKSPFNFTLTFSKQLAVITDTANKMIATTPAQVTLKAFSGALVEAHASGYIFGRKEVIENAVKDTVANALGNNNFTLKQTFEANTVGCYTTPAKTIECANGVTQLFTVEAQ